MPTVLFDLDSTLITCESLDELLARALSGQPERVAEVHAITRAGMEGRIDFRESVDRRLALARPARAEAEAFGQEALERLTPGMEELIAGLAAEVWIVSGGLREVVLPVAARLGVPPERVRATRPDWSAEGELRGLLECDTKVEQLRAPAASWPRPAVIVGDGMSDHAPLAAGLVDHFIAFTAHVRRAPVVATGAPEARSVPELEYLLAQLL